MNKAPPIPAAPPPPACPFPPLPNPFAMVKSFRVTLGEAGSSAVNGAVPAPTKNGRYRSFPLTVKFSFPDPTITVL